MRKRENGKKEEIVMNEKKKPVGQPSLWGKEDVVKDKKIVINEKKLVGQNSLWGKENMIKHTRNCG